LIVPPRSKSQEEIKEQCGSSDALCIPPLRPQLTQIVGKQGLMLRVDKKTLAANVIGTWRIDCFGSQAQNWYYLQSFVKAEA